MCSNQGTADLQAALSDLDLEAADVLDPQHIEVIKSRICEIAQAGVRSATPGHNALREMQNEQRYKLASAPKPATPVAA